MKFTRSVYPNCPSAQGSPCWHVKARWLDVHAYWNTRFPFGASLGFGLGPAQGAAPRAWRFLLDLNAPLGEPNRLHLNLGHWHVVLGLASWWEFRKTGRDGRVIQGEHVRCRPHLDGISRYRYHRTESSGWVRNGKPEPLHWGWLTIERNDHG